MAAMADPPAVTSSEHTNAAASGAAQRADDVAASVQPANPTAYPLNGRQLLSVAPMMDWTDVHFRQLARLVSKHTWLWTEMVVDKTVIHTPQLDRFLWFPPEQRPIVLQLGGSDPASLAAAAAKAAQYGYDEINLNCGCPSDRVAGAGCFGASLMLEPDVVARCMAAMAEVLGPGTPVNVKCRLGVDDADSYGQLRDFVRVVSEHSPVTHFIVHSRKCLLRGLNPHQNRTVPPLRHNWVWALKQDFPHLQFSLNGGLQSCHEAASALAAPMPRPATTAAASTSAADDAAGPQATTANGASTSAHGTGGAQQPEQQQLQQQLQAVPEDGSSLDADTPVAASSSLTPSLPRLDIIEGVMIGRGAYNDPWGCLSDADRALFGAAENAAPSRRWVVQQYRVYAEAMHGRWGTKADGHRSPSVRTLMRPLLNLFHGEPGCKKWKNTVDGLLKDDPDTFGEVLDKSLHLLPDHVLDAPPRQPDLAALPPFQLDQSVPEPYTRAGNKQIPAGPYAHLAPPEVHAAAAAAAAAQHPQGRPSASAPAPQGPAAAVAAAAVNGASASERDGEGGDGDGDSSAAGSGDEVDSCCGGGRDCADEREAVGVSRVCDAGQQQQQQEHEQQLQQHQHQQTAVFAAVQTLSLEEQHGGLEGQHVGAGAVVGDGEQLVGGASTVSPSSNPAPCSAAVAMVASAPAGPAAGGGGAGHMKGG